MLDNNALIAAATPVFFALIALELWLARRRKVQTHQLADSLTSMACGIWTVTLEVFIKGSLLLVYAGLFEAYAPLRFGTESVTAWVLFFIVLDFLYYWAHRWSHEVNFLWAGHAPHHQSEEYNFTTALRQGAFQDAMHFPIFCGMALMGCPPAMFIVLLTVSKFYQFWIHTRMIDKVPLLEGVLNTPSAHRVHHAVNDIYLDRNYGATLMLWDRLFGTWLAETAPCVFGVRKGAPGWNAVNAQFTWFAAMWRDAAQAGRWRDKLAIWVRPTGWRPPDVAARDPQPPFVLPAGPLHTATRGPRWMALALLLFVLAVALSNVLISQAASLSWSARLALAGGVTAALLLMARALQPRG